MATKILVIEDDGDILQNIIETLGYEGFEVMGAGTGLEGLALVDTFEPDLILCDIMMPEVDGYEVLARLQAQNRVPHIPFIFLTAKAHRQEIRYGMDLGADDYLSKPFLPAELISMIQTRLDLKHARENETKARLDQLRKSLAHSLPHELRTPLAGIVGYTQMLLDDYQDLSDDVRVVLGSLLRAGERLTNLVENYLYYANLELLYYDPERQKRLSNSLTEDSDLVIEAVARDKAQLYGREADLVLKLQPLPIQVSNTDLMHLVTELVGNACKFSNQGTPIELTSIGTGVQFCLTLKDYGRGMTHEQIQSVGAYVQFNRRIYEQQGVGLGLAIAQLLAKVYNGSLFIESQPNHYTLVTVYLPLAN